jgi:Tol biopolymer transport system component
LQSKAGDLVGGDHTVHWTDIFVRDLVARTTVRASVDTEGGDPNGGSFAPSITPDGRYVAFYSSASDLVPGDGNGYDDVFVRDLVAGTTVRVSVGAGGGDANSASRSPSISADARYVAFDSYASDLVAADGNGFADVFVRDLVAGTTVLASVDTNGGDSDGHTFAPSLSADGTDVAFYSYASDLVPGDQNGVVDVFVRNLVAGTTVRASVSTDGGDAHDSSWQPSISADGQHVAFWSYAGDLVVKDGNHLADIFVRDLVAGTTVRASVDTAGHDSDGGSFACALSSDGRYVMFQSNASDLVTGDGNGLSDVFLRSLDDRVTTRVSVDTAGGDPNGGSGGPLISASGRYVAFFSYAGDLVPGRGDKGADVFLARWG